MKGIKHLKTTTIITYAGLALLAFGCFALSSQAGQSVCQEGCDLLNGNTFLGGDALLDNTGAENTAIGHEALRLNTTGIFNTATGYEALFENTTGQLNTANGAYALWQTTGSYNTGFGYGALLYNTTGSYNIALGYGAGGNLTTGINNIDIGNSGIAGESKTIRIGKLTKQTNTYIIGISGVAVAGGVGVIIDNNGHMGTVVSSARYKEAIEPMDKASEAIFALKPVTFRYKKDLDAAGIPQFGLVAEQVEKVNPDLVAQDEQGKPYTVRYDAVNAMLLNELLKEHRKNEKQESKIEQQDAKIAQQQKQIETLTAGLQKVSAQLQVIKAAPTTVLNDQ